jgi:fumarate hydratase subunit alpha
MEVGDMSSDLRIIKSSLITETVKKLCMNANYHLPEDVRKAIDGAREKETNETASGILDELVENYKLADKGVFPICQDTGMACVFLKLGNDLHVDGDLYEAVNEGVRQGYTEGYLRKSVVGDPLNRKNTGDNTPALIYLDLVPGDKLSITVAPKGAGSENMSAVKMLKVSDGVEGVIDFVLESVKNAGPNPCPPVVVGVGIGGNFDKAALLAKKAAVRPLGQHNSSPYYSDLETKLMEKINKLDIGPQGFGGVTTALWVAVEEMATHIAQLPCAVNINCHVTRHETEVL